MNLHRLNRALTVASLLLTLLVTIFHLSGCNIAKVADADFVKNRQLWKQNNIQSYSFTCERIVGGNFAFRPENIEVRDGKVVSRATIDGTPQYNNYDGYSDIETVEKLFDLIQKRFDLGQKLEVSYDEKYGYPVESRIDILGAPDKPFSVRITNFVVL